uniref:(northern house mosquito) hypothetical protein n=1 Tax=Culex pipiens TaxID=7175 RepID=A0A8D8CPV7_CULPI
MRIELLRNLSSKTTNQLWSRSKSYDTFGTRSAISWVMYLANPGIVSHSSILGPFTRYFPVIELLTPFGFLSSSDRNFSPYLSKSFKFWAVGADGLSTINETILVSKALVMKNIKTINDCRTVRSERPA